ncbi:VacJ family lipoprotein [Sphingoaurantiacus capsulatus]|uniref:VacJ family lipoprotein n=1 Tax=Sphingoaurantiacus capsulatus TaxID=1771310 RepID=A0ABV7XCZ5_9SPHN
MTASLLAACATTPGNQLAAERDPWEKTNRGVYKFNRGLDKAVVTPATKVYRAVTPKAAQRGIGNAFNNVDEPFSFVNAVLQGKVRQAFRTAARFLINTTLGVGGLADHATDMGLPEEPEDLGQTLAVWGLDSGAYVMLPLFGPSTVRDTIGFAVERFSDPYRLALNEANLDTMETIGVTGLELADTRSYVMDTADPLLEGSADEYATVKSAYLQYRWNAIHDGAPPEDYDETHPVEQIPAAAPTDPDPVAAPAATAPGEATPAPADAPAAEPPAPAATTPAAEPTPAPAPEKPTEPKP